MPTIEERAQVKSLIASARSMCGSSLVVDKLARDLANELERAFETLDAERAAHAQFRQEVSDAVRQYERELDGGAGDFTKLRRFILPKPVDPLVEAIREASVSDADDGDASRLRAALAKRGLKLVDVGDAD